MRISPTVVSGVAAGVVAALAVGSATGVLRIGEPAAMIGSAILLTALALQFRQAAKSHRLDEAAHRTQIRHLQEKLDRQRLTVDSLADGLELALFLCDGRGHVEYANRRACEIFRIEQPAGKSLLALTLSHELERLVLQSSSEQRDVSAEISFSYPSERVGIAKAWHNPAGRTFLSIYDVTNLRRLERIRQDFVANVSHEMRTPMTIIRAMAETLTEDDDPELRQRYLTKIMGEIDRLSTISQDLLVLSSAESNPVRKQACDIADVCRGVILQTTPKAQAKGLRLDYEGPVDLVIAANTNQMTQVVLNLVDNAINYTPEGTVSVRLRSDESYAYIEVRDTGMGIATEHLPRIFERFYRVDKARSRSTGGTGLGLSISKHIVEAHGGRIAVDSVLNRGSTFTAILPLTDDPRPRAFTESLPEPTD